MSIKFKVVERGRPDRPGVPKKYYPYIYSTGRVTDRGLAEEASEMSTLSTPDVMAVIEALLILIPKHLVDGEVVELGGLGSIWLRFSADGAETEKEVSGKLIKTLLPRFMPSKEFVRTLKGVKFKKSTPSRKSKKSP